MFIEIAVLLAVIALLLYKKLKAKANFFVQRNVKYDKYRPSLWTFIDFLLQRKSFFDAIIEIYRKFEGEK